MKSYQYRIAFFLLISLLLTNCGKIDEIEIGEIQEVNLKGFEDNAALLDVIVPIDNPSMYRIKLTNLDIDTYIKDRYVGKLLLDDDLVIKSKKSDVYELPVRIRVTNVLDIIFLMTNVKQGYEVDIRFVGSATAKSCLMKRTMNIDEKREIVF